jgi:biotin carboxyl carrier protein
MAEDHHVIEVWRDGRRAVLPKAQPPSVEQAARSDGRLDGDQTLLAPLTGMVIKVTVNEGDRVEPRQTLFVLEAMKMEHVVQAPAAGTVKRIHVRAGLLAPAGSPLLDLSTG